MNKWPLGLCLGHALPEDEGKVGCAQGGPPKSYCWKGLLDGQPKGGCMDNSNEELETCRNSGGAPFDGVEGTVKDYCCGTDLCNDATPLPRRSSALAALLALFLPALFA